MSALRDALRDLSDDVFFDLLESTDRYLLVLDVPGVTADSIDLAIEDGRLSIDAQRQKDLPDDYRYLEENRSLFFDVELPLPDDAVEADLDAAVDRGVLELSIPKRTGDGETTIDVVEGTVRDGEDGDENEDGDVDADEPAGTDPDADPEPESDADPEPR
ncbi:Hsp20/alpha crystallin family protein [Halopiger xanaduensis]|uniref:Heat shock protein Hsp20 n=1 Tax=Halopiger xanaduensis (strain DSM 18323 / JCM 14033 / SH-6) TaxID=797210 RepID=F8D8K9_HALXS|nr:Hsp20/alpha crystallin family protein [Halopiger xanaduensis]AEH36761.1 heat shock protein Hsp20 [Halopiger xanaduensis SH-6]